MATTPTNNTNTAEPATAELPTPSSTASSTPGNTINMYNNQFLKSFDQFCTLGAEKFTTAACVTVSLALREQIMGDVKPSIAFGKLKNHGGGKRTHAIRVGNAGI